MNLANAFKIYPYIFWHRLTGGPARRRPLYGYFNYVGKRPTKLALLSYRPHGLWLQAKYTWSSIGDVHSMIQALSELGYRTDVVDTYDMDFVPSKPYDLFIGHEGYNFKNIYKRLSAKTKKIALGMTAYWQWQNEQEAKRLEDLANRKGITLKAERASGIQANDDFSLDKADRIVLQGNEDCRRTYPKWVQDKISILEGATYFDRGLADVNARDYTKSRRNFLFLSGSGNVLKGLDLTLEAFKKMSDQHLYICTKLEPDFKEIYKAELFHTSNIHFIGLIKLYSKRFFELVKTCNYLIFPSASEGNPGSVMDAMAQGLIPIISRPAHIDIDGLGYYLEPCTIDGISSTISQVANNSLEFIRDLSLKNQTAARQRFSERGYIERFKNIIQSVCKAV